MSRYPTTVLCLILVVSVLGCGRAKRSSTRGAGGETVTRSKSSSEVSAIPAEHLGRIADLFNQGVGLMDRYRPSEAVQAFEEVVRLAPDWTTGRLNLGIALLNSHLDLPGKVKL